MGLVHSSKEKSRGVNLGVVAPAAGNPSNGVKGLRQGDSFDSDTSLGYTVSQNKQPQVETAWLPI